MRYAGVVLTSAWLVISWLANPLARAADKLWTIDLGSGEKIELVLVPHGVFQQGSVDSEEGREGDELSHRVVITKDFYLSKYPVTVGQFRRFVEATGYKTEAEKGTSGGNGLVGDKLEQKPEFNWKNPGYATTDQHPVTIVTIADTIAFNEWLTKKVETTIQLPSESQWEYACRSGTESRFYSGSNDSDLDKIGWHKGNSNKPMPVGQKQPNAWGLYDMCGNVYQWCGDFYAPYKGNDLIDPQLQTAPAGDTARIVLRGGSFMRTPKRCRSAARYRATAGTRNAENGFRIASVVTLPEGEITQMLEQSTKVNEPNAPDKTAVDPMSVNPPIALETNSPEIETNQFQNSELQNIDNRSSSNRGSRLGVLCGVVFLLILLGVGGLVFLLNMSRPRSTVSEPAQAIGGYVEPLRSTVNRTGPSSTVQVSDDGFWIRTAGYTIGANLFYHYYAAGMRHDGSCLINSGDRQFVYTGNQPSEVHIDRIDEPDDPPQQPYDSTQDNSAAYGQFYQQRHSHNSQSAPSTPMEDSTGKNEAAPPETSPDRSLLSGNGSTNTGFPPAY